MQQQGKQVIKGQKQHSSQSDLILSVAKPKRKKSQRRTNCPPTPIPITEEPGRGSWDTSDNESRLRFLVIGKQHWELKAQNPTACHAHHHRSGALRLKQPGHRGDTHLFQEHREFSTGKGTLPHSDPRIPHSAGKRKQKPVL